MMPTQQPSAVGEKSEAGPWANFLACKNGGLRANRRGAAKNTHKALDREGCLRQIAVRAEGKAVTQSQEHCPAETVERRFDES